MWLPYSPLSTVGMPFYREVLLSAWPPNLVTDVGAPPAPLDPSFLATLKQTEWGWYGRNTRPGHRNQVEDTRKRDNNATVKAPKFLSEKARESTSSSALNAPADIKQAAEALLSNSDLESLKPEAPAMYRNFEIRYSKFGVDDFDFR
jgi:PAB-dependent poly(A)-specific ribonuclease subunit 2